MRGGTVIGFRFFMRGGTVIGFRFFMRGAAGLVLRRCFCFCGAAAGAAPVRGLPHPVQNLSPALIICPHAPHRRDTGSRGRCFVDALWRIFGTTPVARCWLSVFRGIGSLAKLDRSQYSHNRPAFPPRRGRRARQTRRAWGLSGRPGACLGVSEPGLPKVKNSP